MNLFSIKHITLVIGLNLVAMVGAHAQTCPTVSSDTTVTSSCDTGITLTGNNNLTIGTPTSGPVEITNSSGSVSIAVTGTGNTISNRASGEISAGNNGYGIVNVGTITTLDNSGTISAGNNGYGIVNVGTIDTSLTNSGTISVGDRGSGIYNGGYIDTSLTNSGTISVGDSGSGIYNGGYIDTLTNSGSISAGVNGNGIQNTGSATIAMLNNSGTISVAGSGNGISNRGTITILNNSGTISAPSFDAISNEGNIRSLINSHVITGLFYGIANNNVGEIEVITNTGSIIGLTQSGIYNWTAARIGTLNNLQGQGNSNGALTYSGKLPTNYNVIIASANHYGQLAASSTSGTITNFGIYGAPFITSRTYSSVLSGTALPTGTSSGAYDNMTWSLVANGIDNYDLTFTGVSLMGTQQSLVNTAAALQNTYALQNAVLANSFSYDCPVFGEHNVCVSAGGRNTAVSAANGLNNTSALLIAAYRIKPTLRIGAYVDQNLSVNNAGSTVNLGNSTPLIGLFGVWNQRIDGTGTEVKVAAAYGQKNTTVNRQIVGLSEAGTGSSSLNSQGAQITAKYGFAVLPDVLVSPYVGVRYTQNNMGGYTESTSAQVTDPLTYSALNTNATTALAGLGAAYRFIPKATAFASAGVETDTNTSNGTYSATGITGLIPVNFNPNPVKTRPTATLGAYYDIVKNQRIGITGIYRQESYQAISTTTVLATYTIGL
jgi:hypothetical protein